MAVMGIKMKLKKITAGKSGINWQETFKAFDADLSGTLDFEEFKRVFRQGADIPSRELSDDALRTLFRSVDKDASGCIQYETEFLPWLQAVTADRPDIDRGAEETLRRNLRAAAYAQGGINWKRLFSYYDKDNSGEIGFEEFSRAIRKDAKISELELKHDDLKKLYRFIDKDNDGCIQYDPEFIDWIDPNHMERCKMTKEKMYTPTKAKKEASKLKRNNKLSAKAIKDIKNKLKSFCSYNGEVNWRKLFEYYDTDRTGEIGYEKFRVAIRKDAKVGTDKLSEFKLRALFKHVDRDHSGTIAYATEFMDWVDGDDESEVELQEDDVANEGLTQEDPEHLAFLRTKQLQEMLLLGKVSRSFKRARMLLPFIVKWINYVLEVEVVTFDQIEEQLRDGLILSRLITDMGYADKKSTQGLNLRPVGRAMCISNLDLALGIAFRFGVKVGNFCRPEDFYEMRRMKIARCMLEIFDSMQMRKLKRRLASMLREMNPMLAALGRPLMDKTLSDPVFHSTHFLTDFEDCIRLMALLVACKEAPMEKLGEMYGKPDAAQIVKNASIVNAALAKARFPCFLSDEDWSHPPAWDLDPMILQLVEVWNRLREKGQAVVPDFSKFQFRDGVRMEISRQDVLEADKKATEARKRNLEVEPPVQPLGEGARLFAVHVIKMGPIGDVWRNFDNKGNGYVNMKDFEDGARRIGFKGNAKGVFSCIDCNRSGVVERHELEHFCDMAMVPHTVHELEHVKRLAIMHPVFVKYLQLS